MLVESPPVPARLNCVRMTKDDSLTLINALIEARRQLLAEGINLTIHRKTPSKSNSTLRKR
jgi:hypothetical protein